MATARDELALPDYDRLTADELRERLEPLTAAQVERMHRHARDADAPNATVEILAERSEALRDALSTPPTDDAPAFPHHGAGTPGGTVSPATSTAPPINPPSHGDPTNPSQPRG
ncbi:hypothetical protein [Cryptosporangium japonicum]|uniref:Uncharacterized protein n=1 Tax=Cryptosporangium japonicum TaxID=80872 RepID=A0ABP3E2A3_9ACTN